MLVSLLGIKPKRDWVKSVISTFFKHVLCQQIKYYHRHCDWSIEFYQQVIIVSLFMKCDKYSIAEILLKTLYYPLHIYNTFEGTSKFIKCGDFASVTGMLLIFPMFY